MVMQNRFLEAFNIYRGKAALQISLSPELGLVFLNLAPAIPGMEYKMPGNGGKKYQWDKRLTVSFNFDAALEVAAVAEALTQGRENLVRDAQGNLPSWYRDPSKTGRNGNPKTFGFYRVGNQQQASKVPYYLGIIENTGDKKGSKIGIPLDHTDLFKIACLMKEAALVLLGWRTEAAERTSKEVSREQNPSASSQKAAVSKDEDFF